MKHHWFNIFFNHVGWFDLSNMAFKSLIPCLMNRWNCNMGNHPWIYVWIRLSLGKSTWFRRSKKSNKGFNPKWYSLSSKKLYPISIYVRYTRLWRIHHWILWISFFVTEFSARFVALLGESHFFSLNSVTFLTLIFLFL